MLGSDTRKSQLGKNRSGIKLGDTIRREDSGLMTLNTLQSEKGELPQNDKYSENSLDEKLKNIEDTDVINVARQIKKMNLNLSSIDQIDFEDAHPKPKESILALRFKE